MGTEKDASCLKRGPAAFRTSALQPLRAYISEQLAAAAEEIFRQVENTFTQLEEELCHQHSLLGTSWKPQLHISAPPQHHVSAGQEQRNPERISRGKRREPELPCVKEEWEEVVISLERKPLDLKEELDVSMETPASEEKQQSLASLNSHQIKTVMEKPQKSVGKVTCVMSGPRQKLQENGSIPPTTAVCPSAATAPLPSTVAHSVQRHPPNNIGLLEPVTLMTGQVVFKSLNQVYLAPNPAAPVLNTCSLRTKRPSEQQFRSQPYIKKPPNAFMLFLKEQRAAVPPELRSNSSAVNKLLGEKWSLLSEEQKAKYFNQADEEKRLHAQQHPDWSSSENYGKKKRKGATSRIQGKTF